MIETGCRRIRFNRCAFAGASLDPQAWDRRAQMITQKHVKSLAGVAR